MRLIFSFLFVAFLPSYFGHAAKISKNDLSKKGDQLQKVLVQAVGLKTSLEKEFNKSIDELKKEKPDHQKIRVEWGRFSHLFNKDLKQAEQNPLLGAGGIPSTAEDMAKFEIKNYMGNLRTLWSVVSKGVQGRGFNQKEYEDFNKMLGNSFDNAQLCIKALKSGNNSLDGIDLKK